MRTVSGASREPNAMREPPDNAIQYVNRFSAYYTIALDSSSHLTTAPLTSVKRGAAFSRSSSGTATRFGRERDPGSSVNSFVKATVKYRTYLVSSLQPVSPIGRDIIRSLTNKAKGAKSA